MGKVLTDRDIDVSKNYVIPNFSSYASSRCVVQGEISPQTSSNTASTYYRFIKSTDNYRVVTYSEFKEAPQEDKIQLDIKIVVSGDWILADNTAGQLGQYIHNNYIVSGDWSDSPINYYYSYDGDILLLSQNDSSIYDSAGALEYSIVGGNQTLGYFNTESGNNKLKQSPDGFTYGFLTTDSNQIIEFRTNYSIKHDISINLFTKLNDDYGSSTAYKMVDENNNMKFVSSLDTKLRITYNKTTEELTVVVCDFFEDSYYGSPISVYNTRNGLTITKTSQGKKVAGTIHLPLMVSLFAT